MNEIIKKDSITSLELLEQINFFRKQEGKIKDLLHKNLLSIIRDEFEEELAELNFQPGKSKKNIINESLYYDKNNQARPMYILTLNQAKQVLARES